jgi:6-pyruvoyltetrahydropterin/6-carboxytetrahydropterin synthase
VPGSRYTVRVTKDFLVFSAGHFITFNGDTCERMHGHNYRVAVEVEDVLDENQYVFDFILLRDLTRGLVDELDHRMLLPAQSSLITLQKDGPNWLVRFRDRHWSFPRDECVVLPVSNTTAERLADVIGDRLRDAIRAKPMHLPSAMRVEVEECFGQWAISEWRRDDP